MTIGDFRINQEKYNGLLETLSDVLPKCKSYAFFATLIYNGKQVQTVPFDFAEVLLIMCSDSLLINESVVPIKHKLYTTDELTGVKRYNIQLIC